MSAQSYKLMQRNSFADNTFLRDLNMTRPGRASPTSMPVHIFSLAASGLLIASAGIGYLINQISPVVAVELILVMAVYYLLIGLYETAVTAWSRSLRKRRRPSSSFPQRSVAGSAAQLAAISQLLSPSND